METTMLDKVKTALRLSTDAYDTELEGKSIIRTLDMLICEDGAISSIRDYFNEVKDIDERLKYLKEIFTILMAFF